ncbi:MAG TPA: hypothetical protein VFU74_04685 [Actinocrinis sp.]|nr:hypothetical protein [Actinocrinis sp.]
MAESRLIRDYRASLARRLPGTIVDELIDGLEQTYQRHLGAGLGQDVAAREALAEFGDPHTLMELFAAEASARRTARSLLATGPLVGACWATLLITARAWDWPMPTLARAGFGLLLCAVIALLAVAARTGNYRRGRHAATLACLGLVTLDATLGAALLRSAMHGWLVLLAAAGCARITFTVRALRRIRAH